MHKSRLNPSMYASTAALIQLVAISSNVLPGSVYREVLYDNEAVNSSFGTIPIRYLVLTYTYILDTLLHTILTVLRPTGS